MNNNAVQALLAKDAAQTNGMDELQVKFLHRKRVSEGRSTIRLRTIPSPSYGKGSISSPGSSTVLRPIPLFDIRGHIGFFESEIAKKNLCAAKERRRQLTVAKNNNQAEASRTARTGSDDDASAL